MSESYIIQKLESIEKKLFEQNMLQKEVLNFNEAAVYLDGYSGDTDPPCPVMLTPLRDYGSMNLNG